MALTIAIAPHIPLHHHCAHRHPSRIAIATATAPQAQASLVEAVRAGKKRLRVELRPPGLNRALEASHAYSAPLLGYSALALAESLRGLRVTAIFASAGDAAAAQRTVERFDGRLGASHVLSGSLSGAVTRDAISEGAHTTPAGPTRARPTCVSWTQHTIAAHATTAH
jgi:hypothetical protein